jgi:hypothetical protein
MLHFDTVSYTDPLVIWLMSLATKQMAGSTASPLFKFADCWGPHLVDQYGETNNI